MFTWSCLEEGSRDAARTAILANTTSTTPVVNAALNLTTWTGVSAGNVQVAKNGSTVSGSFTKQRGDGMTVTITLTYRVLLAQSLGAAFPSIPFTSLPITVQPRMRAEG